MNWVRSGIFVFQMYLVMALMALIFTPVVMLFRELAFVGIRSYSAWVRFTARWIVGIKTEIRGEVPDGDVLVCSKHQSFLDILLLCSALPRPRFIMKEQMRRTPIVGYYANRIGCVSVDRGRGSVAIEQMMTGVAKNDNVPGQLVIFPQGTRVLPGAKAKYKLGAALLYGHLGTDCIPVATNVGVFWPRTGIRRTAGTAILEFCPAIAPGLSQKKFMNEMKRVVESNSDRLMAEAGFEADARK